MITWSFFENCRQSSENHDYEKNGVETLRIVVIRTEKKSRTENF